jgi:hypothetical protein
MVDLDDKESKRLAQVVAAGVTRLDGRQRSSRAVFRAIATRRRNAPPYFVASGVGISALTEWNRAYGLPHGCPERRGALAPDFLKTTHPELDHCAVGARTTRPVARFRGGCAR